MKFRRVQANKGMQPKRAKGQHWATRQGSQPRIWICQHTFLKCPLLLIPCISQGKWPELYCLVGCYVYFGVRTLDDTTAAPMWKLCSLGPVRHIFKSWTSFLVAVLKISFQLESFQNQRSQGASQHYRHQQCPWWPEPGRKANSPWKMRSHSHVENLISVPESLLLLLLDLLVQPCAAFGGSLMNCMEFCWKVFGKWESEGTTKFWEGNVKQNITDMLKVRL